MTTGRVRSSNAHRRQFVRHRWVTHELATVGYSPCWPRHQLAPWSARTFQLSLASTASSRKLASLRDWPGRLLTHVCNVRQIRPTSTA
jgi:hypothetical protein